MKAIILTEDQKNFTINYDCLYVPVEIENQWVILVDDDYDFTDVGYEWLQECQYKNIEI